jgi:fructuronate reductase
LWSELIPTLPQDKGLEPDLYTAKLAARFSNTALKHRTAQIANDGSQKLPQRIIEAACERLAVQASADYLSFVVAAWIAALQARSKEMAFSDPLDPQLTEIDFGAPDHAKTVNTIFEITGFAKARQEKPKLVQRVANHLKMIHTIGQKQALQKLTGKAETE